MSWYFKRTSSTPAAVSPGTSGLVAWYDFADAVNAANPGTLNLQPQGSPVYTPGPPSYGTSTDGSPTPGNYWLQGSLDDVWGHTTGDWSVVIRFRGKSGIVNNDYVLFGNGGRTAVRWVTTGITGFSGSLSGVSSGVPPVEDTWYTAVVVGRAAGTTSISVNGAAFVTQTLGRSNNIGSFHFGANSTTNSNPVDIDFAGFYSKELTQENVTWLNPPGGTRTYAEVSA